MLRYVLRNPALAPSSALFRRRVVDDVGPFDTALPTAEDLDFHLRVALRWKIGVIPEPLTRAMRGHDGLSSLPRTYADYLDVMERFMAAHPGDAGSRPARRTACCGLAQHARAAGLGPRRGRPGPRRPRRRPSALGIGEVLGLGR